MSSLQHPELTCEQVESRLAQLVERRQTDVPAELVKHAELCEQCQFAVQEFALLAKVIPEWKIQIPDVDLVDQVLDQIELTNKSASSNGRPQTPRPIAIRHAQSTDRDSHSSLVMVLAAAVCLILCFELSRRIPDAATNMDLVDQSTLPAEETPIEVPLTPETPPSSSTADMRLVNFSHTAVDAVTELAKSVVPMIDDDDGEATESTQGFADQLEPIGQSVDRMVDRFFDTLSPSTSNS